MKKFPTEWKTATETTIVLKMHKTMLLKVDWQPKIQKVNWHYFSLYSYLIVVCFAVMISPQRQVFILMSLPGIKTKNRNANIQSETFVCFFPPP